MKVDIKQMLIAGVVLVSSFAALAAPAPLTNAELDEQAPVIVDARVVGVEVLGESEVPGEFHKVHLEASLEVIEVYKGDAVDGVRIKFDVELGNPGQAMCATEEPAHWEGEVSKLWLTPRADGTHRMVHWNAQEEAAESDPQPLTTEQMLGQSAEASDSHGGGCSMAATSGPAGFGLVVLSALFLVGFRSRQTNV